MLLALTASLAIVAVAAPATENASLGKTFRKVCDSVEERAAGTGDAELAAAARGCAQAPAPGALRLVRELARLARKDAQAAPSRRAAGERLEFLSDALGKLRKALVKSTEWRRPPAAHDVSAGIRELSGLTFDSKRNALFGIGDERPRLARLNPAARFAIEFLDVDGVRIVDTEAVIAAPDGKIWIMDTGDNHHERASAAAYVVDPDRAVRGRVTPERRVTIRYPHGRRPDVEAAFFHGNALYLIEKTPYRPAELFGANLTVGRDELAMRSLGFLPAGSPISDASLDPASGRLFVVGWFDVREIVDWARGSRFDRILAENFFGQQEGLALDPRNAAFFLGTEEGLIFRL